MLDLFSGRWGWAKAFADRNWDCVGFDLVKPPEIPARCCFVQQDILELTLDRGFLDFWEPDFICASSPCEQSSVHGMKHFHPNPPYPELGIQLFNHTRAICEASGIPYVMENVRAAQSFVGRSAHHCGPFHLWGNGVPPLVPQGVKKGFQTGGTIIQKLKKIDRAALTEYRRLNDLSWSSSGSKKRKEFTALAATIPPELANCVADYAERLLEVAA
jgi:site-specific DNA-cytosine methylase